MSQPQSNDPREAKARAKADKAYQKAQRPWFKKKRFIVPLVFIVLFIIIGVSSGGSTTVTPGGSAAPDGPPAFPGATAKDVVAKAGDAVNADGLTVTATPLKAGDGTLGKTLCTTATYNNGTKAAAQFSLIDWKLQDPNGTILNTGFTGSSNMLSTGQIAPGGKAAGDVCFTAPQGSPPGQYVVLLDPTFRFTSDRIAWLNPR